MSRMIRLAVTALAFGCLGLAVPAAAASYATTPAAVQSPAHKPVQLSARPDRGQIHRGEHVKLRGHLATGVGHGAPEILLVQVWRGGGWVTVATGRCQPDSDFVIDLSFNVSANLTLRVYHPQSALFAAAFVQFSLVVI
jgi:hypothetical protein